MSYYRFAKRFAREAPDGEIKKKAKIWTSLRAPSVRQIGFTSWFSRTMRLKTALDYLAEAKCTEVEIAAMSTLIHRWKPVIRLLKEREMDLTAISLGVPFHYSSSALDLHSPKWATREATIRYVREGIDFASRLEAGLIYACSMTRGPPDRRKETLDRLRDSIATCADYAKGAGVRFGLEPFPTGELPTIAQTNAFIEDASISNLGIVVDAGHAAISGEALAASVRESFRNVIHVHLNNNDGIADLHWPPQRGKLPAQDFSSLLNALRDQRYRGKISVELSRPKQVVRTIIESRAFVQKMMM